MEIAEPNFLGKIRFGAGKNCACQPIGVGGVDGFAKIRYTKYHHSWGQLGTGAKYVPNTAWRSLTTSGSFFGPFKTPEGDSVGSMLGTWLLDRRTGLSNRGIWFLRDGEYLVSSTASSAEFFYPGSDLQFDAARSGTIRLGTPYTIEQLNDDVQALMDSTATSIWLVPPEKSLDVGVEEIGAGSFGPWIDQNYINGGPCTGKISVRETYPYTFFRQNVGAVSTFFGWGGSMSRDRGLAPLEGYFSTQVTTAWDGGIGPEKPPRIVEPKRYWYTQPRRTQFDSLPITPAEASLPYARVAKYLEITLNDMPPSGQEAKDWPTTSIPGLC